jgi:phage shock protein C
MAMENTSDAIVRPSFDKQQQAPVDPAPAGRPGTPFGDPAAFADSAALPDSATEAVPARPAGFRMHRSRTDRMLGGVCGGLAESLDVDAALLRIGLVALTVLGAGIGVVLYVAAWILVPEADPA